MRSRLPKLAGRQIEANIYCIASQMLGNPALLNNRPTGYSHTFQNIDEMVQLLCKRYLKLATNNEPFLATYSDGRHTSGTGLWQWGSVALAMRDLDALEILRHYFPKDIEIIEDDDLMDLHNHTNTSPLTSSSHTQPNGQVATNQLLAMYLISQIFKPETI